MVIDSFCAQVAGRAASARWLPALALCAAALLAGCTTGPVPSQQAAVPSHSTPKPPREALPFKDSVASLATSVFGRAEMDQSARRTLVVDPLIDRATGNQSAATRAMEAGMLEVAREKFPQWEPRPFTAAELERKPLLLVGSITTVEAPGVIPPRTGTGEPSTYRIWAVLADLETGKVVAHETSWVRPEGVNMTPTAFFKDSPAWTTDQHKAAYLRTCALDAGAPIDPVYLNGLTAATYAASAIRAYEDGRYLEALNSYQAAKQLPSGDDELRIDIAVALADDDAGIGHAPGIKLAPRNIAVVEAVHRSARRKVAERRARHDLGDRAAQNDLLGREQRNVHRRQPIVIAALHGDRRPVVQAGG